MTESPTPQSYQPAEQPATVPGKGLAIAGLVIDFFIPLVGLILGIVAMVQAKKAGMKNGIALAAVIVGAVLLVVQIIVVLVWTSITATLVAGGAMDLAQAAEACLNGAPYVEIAGQTIMCEEVLAEM